MEKFEKMVGNMKIEDKKLLKQSFKDKNVSYILMGIGIVIVANIVYTNTTNNIKILISVLVGTIIFFLILGIQIWFDYKSKLRNKPKNF
jgi:uncharacterized membrane protein